MDLLAFHLAEFGFLKEGLFSKLHPLQFPTLSPQQSGYIFLQKGIYETSTRRNDWLTTAAEDFEYSIACSGGEIQCDPLLLIGLFEAFYHNRHLSKAGAIAETLSIRYPEVAALKSSLSMIDEIQKVWPLGQMPLPQWVSMK
jgi:hypothetical protein